MGQVVKLASGATEQDINRALVALKDGDTLVLPKDAVIKITSGIKVDVSARDITLDLNGSTLQQAGNVTVLNGYGAHVDASAVGLSKNAAGDAVVTYANAQSSLKVGDWIKVFADDGIPHGFQTGDTPTRLGQALQVKAIDGGKVTLDGALVYQESYQTNIRASEYNSGQLVVRNGTVQGDQSHADWKSDLVQIRSAVDAKVEHLTVQNGNSMGINIVDSVDALVQDATVRNLKDNPSQGYLGYAVHSASSTGTTVVGLYADKVRHATDDNAVGVSAGHPNPSKYGADIGMTVKDSVAYNTTSFAYGWHSEGVNGTVTDSLAFDSMGFVGGRGTGNSVSDSAGANLLKGILLYEYGDGDGRGLTFDNISLKEVRDYAYYTSGSPLDNLIKNSTFEVLNKVTSIGTAGVLENVKVMQGKFALSDLVVGTDKADKLLGGQGKDIILGGGGDDYIWGGAEADILTGGSGHDRFAYHKLSEGGDTILDFNPTVDVIDVSILAAQLRWTGDFLNKGYLRVVQDGLQTLIQANDDGQANDYVTMAKLLGVDANDIKASNFQATISGLPLTETPSETPATSPAAQPASAAPLPSKPLESATPTAETSTWHDGSAVSTTLSGYDLKATETDLAYLGTSAFSGVGNGLDNHLSGGAGADRLEGKAGNDILDGRAGADVMIGGAGDDTYIVDHAGDVVTELAEEGTDTIKTSLQSYTLGTNVENLTYTGAKFISAVGNELSNVLTGGAGNDKLDGKAGADTMIGGSGDDTYTVENVGDVIVELSGGGNDRVLSSVSYTLSENIETLQLTAGLSINGFGNALANTLIGNSGANILDGGGGTDVMTGGKGNDIYVVDNAGDKVSELAGEGIDTVQTSLQGYTLGANIENLLYTGAKSFTGIGNELNNVLTGGTGNNRLDGKAGADTMIGDAGNDTYVVDNVGDVVIERAGNGNDRVLSSVSYTLSDNVETLQLTTSLSNNGTGNALANVLIGNNGANILDGRGGADVLTGGKGNDTFVFRAGETHGDIITDFTGAGSAVGDKIQFMGYGKGAYLVQVDHSDIYQVHGGVGHQSLIETIQIANVVHLDLATGGSHNDLLFV